MMDRRRQTVASAFVSKYETHKQTSRQGLAFREF